MFLGGFLLFLLIFVMAFWILIFLAGFALPYSLTIWAINKIRPIESEEESAEDSE